MLGYINRINSFDDFIKIVKPLQNKVKYSVDYFCVISFWIYC